MRRFFLLLILLTTSAGAFAQSAGKVDKLLPAGFIARGSSTETAKPADAVQWNDILRTNDQGRMRVALDDGSMLSVGAKSELRVVKHDTLSNQTVIEMLYGKARANVVPIRKNGGSFQVRTPTAVIGVLGTTVDVETVGTSSTLSGAVIENLPTPRRNIADLAQLTPGTMPSKSTPDTPTIADYLPVDGTVVRSLDRMVGVRSIDPEIIKTVYLMPGQYTYVARGMPPTDPQFGEFYANPPQPKPSTSPQLLQTGCRFPTITSFDSISGALDKALDYEITGRGTSTGNVFTVAVKNNTGCPLNLQVPAGAVLKPTGYTGRLVKGILMGGGMPPLKDYQVMMAEGGFGEIPAQGANADLPVMFYFLPPDAEETTFTLRGYCLEMHKLAPHAKTKYKFADADEQKRLSAPNLKVMETANKLFFTGQANPPMASLDSLVQWSLWASREGINDAKKFEEEYVGLVKRNHEAQKKKFDKSAKEQTQQIARTFWPYVQKVVAAAK